MVGFPGTELIKRKLTKSGNNDKTVLSENVCRNLKQKYGSWQLLMSGQRKGFGMAGLCRF
jgi:hypothetical protein